MTEIRIEKKRSLFPWRLVGLALLAIIIYFFRNGSDSKTDDEQFAIALITVRENNPTVIDFVQFVNQNSSKMTLGHAYTNQAILKLGDTINAMAEEIKFEVKADMDKVKEHAVKITNDPVATTHADDIRKATDILGSSLRRMQQSKFPELSQEAEALEKASTAIDPEVLTLSQREAVKEFFHQAANLLEKMN